MAWGCGFPAIVPRSLGSLGLILMSQLDLVISPDPENGLESLESSCPLRVYFAKHHITHHQKHSQRRRAQVLALFPSALASPVLQVRGDRGDAHS